MTSTSYPIVVTTGPVFDPETIRRDLEAYFVRRDRRRDHRRRWVDAARRVRFPGNGLPAPAVPLAVRPPG